MANYFLCLKDHYVTSHRGETLGAGSLCPVADCTSRLHAAPDAEKGPRTCPTCHRGLLLPVLIDDLDVTLCSFCGRTALQRGADGPGEPVTAKPRARTGAERVAAHRARKRAGLQGN